MNARHDFSLLIVTALALVLWATKPAASSPKEVRPADSTFPSGTTAPYGLDGALAHTR